MSRQPGCILLLGVVVLLAAGLAGCARHAHAPADLSASQEPDKVLYEKSREDIQNKRYDVARLTLQTLINTYPDSDYLAAAKLAIADSYYEEGSTGALAHAEVEYKDFITFFPNAPEVARAQFHAAMCHFRQLEKPDRDPTHARRAEEEFQFLLRRYPTSEFAAEGEKKLLQVQEVLAEGEYRVGRFYYVRESWRAAAARLGVLVDRYPNYSRRDSSLWMLGQIYQKEIPYHWPGDPERAAGYYARLVREHPLSRYFPEAKAELARMGKPVPEPDPVLLARAQTVQPVGVEPEEKPGLLGRVFSPLATRPDTSAAAARLGPPPLEHREVTPSVPSPVFRVSDQNQSKVAVQTVEDLPRGTQVETAANTPPAGAAGGPEVNDPEAPNTTAKDNGKESSSRRKSFWRKLVPFM